MGMQRCRGEGEADVEVGRERRMGKEEVEGWWWVVGGDGRRSFARWSDRAMLTSTNIASERELSVGGITGR